MQVGVKGTDVIVLAVEKKSTAKLQEARTVRKIHVLDSHLCLGAQYGFPFASHHGIFGLALTGCAVS